MLKKLLVLYLSIFVVSCSTNKLSHEFFSECEDSHDSFSKISACGLTKVDKVCLNSNDCYLFNDRFVNIIEQLNLMVINKEISENEALFRYLNIINSFENDKQILQNKMNNFPHDYNYTRFRNYPFYLNCNTHFLNICM